MPTQQFRAVDDDVSVQAFQFLHAATRELLDAVKDGSAIEWEWKAEEKPLPPIDGFERATTKGMPRSLFLRIIPKS